ncbi:winged helix-turn-helix domain-containing protein [Arthrobacter sp. zg-Y895]|uniref:winged helix-turn-helix domain-containing protein n=1 Tax=Arthrobacter sp. zg-Y895 TaxID=2886933 RepID=UPI003FA49217
MQVILSCWVHPAPHSSRPTPPRPRRSVLKALAHPLRAQLLDTLSQYGPQTASSMGKRVGESRGATSYHLRKLARHGLVRGHAAAPSIELV